MARKAIVIGGGIGGLAAAIGLRQAGLDVEVFEQAAALGEVGSGLSLWRNALVALGRLGVLDELQSLGVFGQDGGVRKPDGRLLVAMKAEHLKDDSTGGMILLLLRAELHRVLLDAAGRDRVRVGMRCVALAQDDQGATARFADGTEACGDVLIGADGLHSVVREQLFGASPPRYAGYTVHRGVTAFDPARIVPCETWGRGLRHGLWALTQGRAYWYTSHAVPEGQPDPPAGRKAHLLDLFRGWHAPVEDVIAATDESAILRSDIFDRPPLPHWSVGRATILGDAAHPMTPDLGQGACQAIEDAVILADCLRDVSDIPAALRVYESRRIPRTSRVVKAARSIGRMACWSNPLAVGFRDALLGSPLAGVMQANQLAWVTAPQV
jgi:2-polyprenyl-6-methoxyphenol hydroxylase-like FAD-dependent oxidoreductase